MHIISRDKGLKGFLESTKQYLRTSAGFDSTPGEGVPIPEGQGKRECSSGSLNQEWLERRDRDRADFEEQARDISSLGDS